MCQIFTNLQAMVNQRNGVTVYAHMLHTHGTGKKVNIHHFRGIQELPPIATDANFDYNFQEVRLMKEPANLRPVSWHIKQKRFAKYVEKKNSAFNIAP